MNRNMYAVHNSDNSIYKEFWGNDAKETALNYAKKYQSKNIVVAEVLYDENTEMYEYIHNIWSSQN